MCRALHPRGMIYHLNRVMTINKNGIENTLNKEHQSSWTIHYFSASGRRARVSEGTTILDAARKLGVGIEAVCGENLVCGKCRVKIMEGEFPKEDITSSLSHVDKVDEKEMKTLKKKEKKENIRLACSTSIMGDILVFVPEANPYRQADCQQGGGKDQGLS